MYAILPRIPKGNFTLKNVQATSKTKVCLLGLKKKVTWKQKGKDLIVNIPLIAFDEIPCDYAWTLKLEHVR